MGRGEREPHLRVSVLMPLSCPGLAGIYGMFTPSPFLSWCCSSSIVAENNEAQPPSSGWLPGSWSAHPTCLSPSRAVVKPEMLQKATVELLDQALCANLYGHSLTDRMVCAGYLDGKVDSCQVSAGAWERGQRPQTIPLPPKWLPEAPLPRKGIFLVSGPSPRFPVWLLTWLWVSFFSLSLLSC